MRELNDYYTIAIDQLYETQSKESKIIKLNEAWVNPEEGTRFVHKRLYGTVVSGPIGFSDVVVDAISPGYPEPKAYVSGDKIQEQRNVGDRTWGRHNYHPGTFAGYEVITMQDYSKDLNIREGERIYFSETVTEQEHFLGFTADMKALYRCRADNVICVIREEKIVMQGSWVLIDPVMQDWDEITTEHGVIMQVKPEAKYLRGIIKHISNDSLMDGDQIFYLPDSNWGITVQDVDFFAIRKKEIIATIKS